MGQWSALYLHSYISFIHTPMHHAFAYIDGGAE